MEISGFAAGLRYYEKFNEHFRALTGLHNASNNQMLKQSCNQLPDAMTRSESFVII